MSAVRERVGRGLHVGRVWSWPARAVARRDADLSARALVDDPRYVEISPEVVLGARAELWAFSSAIDGGPGIVLQRRADIRSDAKLHAYGGRITVGVYSCVNHFCFINGMGGVTIGDDVMMGTGTVILSGEHGTELGSVPMTRQPARSAPVVIEDNVYIGANVVIQAGVTIGSGAVVASGAVVREDVAPGDIVGGVPARVVKTAAERA